MERDPPLHPNHRVRSRSGSREPGHTSEAGTERWRASPQNRNSGLRESTSIVCFLTTRSYLEDAVHLRDSSETPRAAVASLSGTCVSCCELRHVWPCAVRSCLPTALPDVLAASTRARTRRRCDCGNARAHPPRNTCLRASRARKVLRTLRGRRGRSTLGTAGVKGLAFDTGLASGPSGTWGEDPSGPAAVGEADGEQHQNNPFPRPRGIGLWLRSRSGVPKSLKSGTSVAIPNF